MPNKSPNLNEFDPDDEVSYYYGNLNRDHVKEILSNATIGTFLIRDSNKDFDQKVLCVKEAPNCINSYKIMSRVKPVGLVDELGEDGAANSYYIFGKEECLYSSIPKILEFYSTHYLNQSQLVRPAFHHKKVIAMFDFQESDDPSEDLYFHKNDILTVLEYTQGEHWWNASFNGKTGLIPATLVRRLNPNEDYNEQNFPKPQTENEKIDKLHSRDNKELTDDEQANEEPMKCPFKARVIEDYTPSPYETSHIPLKKGQLVSVLEMKSIGKWFGQSYSPDGKVEVGKKGLFPFNRVEIIQA